MGKYDFDKETHRHGTRCVKYDSVDDEDIIPMWVDDMDFETAPCIRRALEKRVAHGIFGYTYVPKSYYESIMGWFARRHHWRIDSSWILYTSGVVPALSCALKALTMPGEKVIVHTPVYNGFFSSIHNSGCEVSESALVRRGDSYEIDFGDFEAKCADPKTSVYVLCNPHNPVGRVWTREELLRIHEICHRYGVRVIADEIQCELVMPGYRYTPFGSLSAESLHDSVTLNSPTKAFNIAGLQIANIICADAAIRRRIDRAININEVCDVNPFGPLALEAAYNEGADWLDELNEYLYNNYVALKEYFHQHLPEVEILRLEGTYLVWGDIMGARLTSDEAASALYEEGNVYVNSGTMYGKRDGEGYLRINIACQQQKMLEGLRRIAETLRGYGFYGNTGLTLGDFKD